MKVIALTSDKGGMGKSTAAINLACAAMEDGIETAILDLDPQASVGRWSRVRKKAGKKSGPFAEVCVPIDVEDRLGELQDAGAQLVILDTVFHGRTGQINGRGGLTHAAFVGCKSYYFHILIAS